MSEIKTVGVLGCGLMGAGIVEVSAKAGYKTLVREVNKTFLARGLERIDNSMNRAVERGKLSADEKGAIAERITGTTQVEDLAACDVIIEAVSENLDIKRVVWDEVAKVKRPGTLLATNTSSIPLTKVAPQTGDPENFLGLHFMNPVPVM
ncbi:MAG: 3-hydroxybutyryl-CoA dehydrogenase, partial [Gemmatimonadetes bacterium]|nr:3-hydroxybutyryl-CoA dehydrogenase [Gemmatimonadota bacterium]